MKQRFTEEQIIGFLREADAGMPVKGEREMKPEPLATLERAGMTFNEPPTVLPDGSAFIVGSLPLPADHPEQLVVAGTLRLVSYNLSDGSERWTVRGLPNEMVSSTVENGGVVYVAGWTAGSGVARMPGWAGLVDT